MSSDPDLHKLERRCTKLFKMVKKLENQLTSAKSDYNDASSQLKEMKKQICNNDNKEKIESLNCIIDSEWIDKKFEWSEKISTVLKEKFGFSSFRPKQLAAINATLSKKDVLLVMPTGGGKSLVYQLPALIDSGFSIVVSPLLSLIEDQLISLEKKGITAATIHSNTPKGDSKGIYQQMTDSESLLKILFVTPEWLAKSKRFLSVAKKCYENNRISRVAIDEVHCCSSWGHDFRPDYGFLGLFRSVLPKVPFLGLTATATTAVLTDVQTMLRLENCMIITAPFNRPNLFYKVLPKPKAKEEVVEYLAKLLKENYANQSGIIYSCTINDCVNLATDLKKKGLRVAPYHAQLDPDQRKQIHRKWLVKSYQAVVATMAFGMGIDKPDVRFVIHHTIPKSMETLYQESGRAGRDGNNADCIVLFGLNDFFKNLGMVSSVTDEKKAYLALEYCLDQEKRSLLATHFEEEWDQSQCNKMCDHCKDSITDLAYYDLSSACSDIHLIIDQATLRDEKLTLNKLLDGWFKPGSKKSGISNVTVPKISKQLAEIVVSYLLLKKFLAIDKGYNTYSTFCYIIKGNEPEEKIEMLSSHKLIGFPKRYLEVGEPSEKKIKLELE